MPKNFYQTIFHPLLHAAGAALYIMAVSWFMMFASESSLEAGFFGPALILILFVFSAAAMAILFFLQPILLFVEGKKKEGLWFLGLTAAWFFIIGVMMFLATGLLFR
jgi:hypothetical protein